MNISEDNLARLQLLSSSAETDRSLQRLIIRSSTNSFIALLLSILLSLVRGRFTLSEQEFACLKKRKNLLHLLIAPPEEGAEAGSNYWSKRRLLTSKRNLLLLSQALAIVLPQLSEPAWSEPQTSTPQKDAE